MNTRHNSLQFEVEMAHPFILICARRIEGIANEHRQPREFVCQRLSCRATFTARHKYLLNACWLTKLAAARWFGRMMIVWAPGQVRKGIDTQLPRILPRTTPSFCRNRPLLFVHRIWLPVPMTAGCGSKWDDDDRLREHIPISVCPSSVLDAPSRRQVPSSSSP